MNGNNNSTSNFNNAPNNNLGTDQISNGNPTPISGYPEPEIPTNFQNQSQVLPNQIGGAGIPPIDPVQIVEQPLPETPVQSPMSTNKSSKKPKGPFLAIFVFVILAAFIFSLPYINNYKNEQRSKKDIEALNAALKKQEEQEKKEEEERQQALEEAKKVKTTICSESPADQGSYVLNREQKIETKNDKIQKVTITSSKVYKTEDATYTEMKMACQEDSLKYIDKEGYTFNCSIEDLTIKTTEIFELDTFTTITDGDKTITAPYQYQASLASTVKTLEGNGVVCK